MPKEIIAWDSSVIIDAIQNHPTRYADIQPMIRRAEADDLLIVVSTASIAEVIYLRELSANGMTQEDQNDLIQKWLDNSYLIKRVADLEVCTKAAEIRRAHDKVTPVDSIIVATAALSGVDALVTYDGIGDDVGLLQLNDKINGLRIVEPGNYSIQHELNYEQR